MIAKEFISAKTFLAQSVNFFRDDKSLRVLAARRGTRAGRWEGRRLRPPTEPPAGGAAPAVADKAKKLPVQ
jgi:hypothetical protein